MCNINLVLYSDVRYQRFIVFYLFTFHSVQDYVRYMFLSLFLNVYARHSSTTFTHNVYNNLLNLLTEHICMGIHPNLTGYIVRIVGWLKRLIYLYPQHCCACPKPRSGFPTPSVVFNGLM